MAYRGLLLCDERFIHANLDSATSDYLEVGPHPGVPVDQGDVRSRMTLQASGDIGATDDLTVTAMSTGFPGSGATYKYQQVASGSTYGWDAPCGISGYQWANLVSDGATAFRTNHPCALRLQSGDVLIACRIAGTTATGDNTEYNTGIYKLTGSTGAVAYVSRAFASSYDQVGAQMKSPALVQLPSGRVLCLDWDVTSSTDSAQVSVAYSDDDGATWSPYADKVLDSPIDSGNYDVTKYSRLRAAYSNGQILLCAQVYDGGYSIYQWGSDDLGTTFRTVSTGLATVGAGSCPNVLPRKGGGFTVVYLDFKTTSARAISSCWDDIVGAGTAITITQPDSTDDLAAWDGEDGSLWAMGSASEAADKARCWCLVSRDGGDTWYPIGSLNSAGGSTTGGTVDAGIWIGGDSGVGLQRFALAEYRGRTVMVSECDVNTAYDQYSLLLLYLGGHTKLCMPRSPRAAYGHANDSIGWATTYAGFFNPTSSAAWTATSGGAPTTDITTNGWDIQLVAGERLYYDLDATLIDDADVSARDYLFLVEVTANTGGDHTSTNDIAFQIHLADGTDDVEAFLRLSSTGFALYDANAGSNAFAPVSNTGSTQYLLWISGSHNATMAVYLYYRAVGSHPGAPLRDWTLAGGGSLTNDTATPAASATLRWGSPALVAGATRAHWRLVCQVGIKSSYGFGLGATGGRWLGNIPATLANGTRIRGVDGPAIQGDSWEILPRFDHGIRNMFTEIAPSPRQTFQTEQQNPTLISVALDNEATMLGTTSIGLSLWNTNIRQFTLAAYDGGAWHDIVTVTNGYTGAFIRHGDVLYVTTTADGVPWLPYERFAGAYVKLDDGAGGISYCRVVHNQSGRWSTESGLRAVLFLHPEDVTGAPTTGTAWLVPTAVTVLIHDISATLYYKWRISVPDGALPAADNARWRIGAAIFGPVAYFGRQYGRGRTIEVQPNVEVQTRRSGTRASRVLGPSRRRYSFAWQENPIDETELGNATTTSPDYIQATTYTSSAAVAAPADTGLLVEGVTERLQGPHRLCVYLPAITKPTGAGGSVVTSTICHPTAHDLVRVVSAPRREAFLGSEGVDELARYADLVLEQEL